MKVNAFNALVPTEYLAPAKLDELLRYIESHTEVVGEVKKKIDNIISAYRNIPGSVSNHETPEKIQEFVESVLKILPSTTRDKVEASAQFITFQKALTKWKEVWLDYLKPIGLNTQGFSRDIDFEDSHNASINQIDFTFDIGAQAKFDLQVINGDVAKSLNLPMVSGDIIINQDFRAGVQLGGKASAQNSLLTLSASLQTEAGGEFDTYYQVDASTPTYKALWNMYKRPLIPWSLTSVDQCLVEGVGDDVSGYKADGYRKLSIKTESKVTLQGKVEIGKSITTKRQITDNTIDFDVVLGGSLSRMQTLSGTVTIEVFKVSNGVLIDSVLNDVRRTEDNFSLGLNASIKGLDKIASEYVRIIINSGDKVVGVLEKYAKPGDILADELKKATAGDELLSNLAKLVLGEQTSSSAIKAMLTNDLREQFNQTPFSSTEDSQVLATKSLDKLLLLFDTKLPSNNAVKTLRNKIETSLAKQIKALQKATTEKAETFFEELEEQGAESVEPLEKLGLDVKEALSNINENAEKRFNTVIQGYVRFKERLQTALEKSANIKIGLKLDKTRIENPTDTSQFSVLIKDVESNDAKLLFKAIVLGDSNKAAKLLNAIPDSIAELNDYSRKFETLVSTKTSLGFSVLDFNSALLTDVSSQVILEVNNLGNLVAKLNYRASQISTGLSETRQAALNMTYGIANAAATPTTSGTFGIEYVNQDDKLHTSREMGDLLGSLDLSSALYADELDFGNGQSTPRLISKDRVFIALEKFNQFRAENVYVESKVSIVMSQSEANFKALLAISPRETFNYAMEYLITLTKTSERAERDLLIKIIDSLIEEDEDISDAFAAADFLDKNQNGTIKGSELKGRLKKALRSFYRQFGDIPDKAKDSAAFDYGWDKLARRLNQYIDTAESIALIKEPIEDISSAVKIFIKDGDFSDSQELNSQLNDFNEELTDSLDKWIQVTSRTSSLISEILSKAGLAQEGINVRFLSFLLLLKQVVKTDEELFLITITLKHKSDPSKNKRIVV